MRVIVIGDWTRACFFFAPAFYGSIMESTELPMEDVCNVHRDIGGNVTNNNSNAATLIKGDRLEARVSI